MKKKSMNLRRFIRIKPWSISFIKEKIQELEGTTVYSDHCWTSTLTKGACAAKAAVLVEKPAEPVAEQTERWKKQLQKNLVVYTM